jgi:hypothetical protein
MTKTRLLLVMAAAMTARVASAQPGTVAPAGAAASSSADPPGFVTIDRLDASSRFGIDVSYLGLDGDATLLRAELAARYVDPATALGGYVQVPFAFARVSGGDRSETVTDLGNIEIGGIYAPRVDAGDLRWVLHAGITLPTAEDGRNEAEVGTIANVARLSEFFNSLPGAVTLKLGVAPVFRRGAFFARVNLGFERNLESKDGSIPDVVHLDAGVGVDLGGSAVMLESANLLVPDEQHGGEVSSKGFTLHELAVSVRGHGAVSPFAAVIVPLDDDLKFLNVALTAGAEFAF